MHACGTIVGQALEFGIAADEASLVTQSVTVTNKIDKKEARDKCGNVITLAFYNATSEISIEGLGLTDKTPGTTLSLAGTYLQVAGAAFIEEVTVEKNNEEFVKSRIKAMAYAGIQSGS